MFRLIGYYILLIFRYGKRTLAGRPEFLFLFAMPYTFVKGSILLLDYAYGVYVYIALGIMIVFWKPSKVSNFLKATLSLKQYWTIFWLERVIRILPFAVLLIYNGYWRYTIIFALAILITPYIQWSAPKNSVIPTPFKKYQWDYISSFRHPFALLCLGGLIFFVFKSVQWEDMEMLLSTIVLIGFLFTSLPLGIEEPPFYIWIYNINSSRFNRKKMLESLPVLLFLIPFLVLYTYLNTLQELWYALLTLLCFIQISIAQILLKYSTIYGYNRIGYSFVFFGFLIIVAKYTDYLYLYPVGIIYIYFLYTKANKNIYPILK